MHGDQALTPAISQDFIQKQNELMQELENLRRLNKNASASEDKLSYSQTINLNNLKSQDNLKSGSDISALQNKLQKEENNNNKSSLKCSQGINDFENLKELDNSQLFSLKKEKE